MNNKREYKVGDTVRITNPHDPEEFPDALSKGVMTKIERIDADEVLPFVLEGDDEYFYTKNMFELVKAAEGSDPEVERHFVAYHGIGSKNLVVADLDQLTESGYPAMVTSFSGDVTEQTRFMHGFTVALELAGVKFTIKAEYCI